MQLISKKTTNNNYIISRSFLFEVILSICCTTVTNYVFAAQNDVVSGNKQEQYLTSVSVYKQSLNNIIKDTKSGGDVNTYNTNDSIGSEAKILTLPKAKYIYDNAIYISKKNNIYPLLSVVENNNYNKTLIYSLLKTSTTKNSEYGGDIGKKLCIDIKHAIKMIENATRDDAHIKSINKDIYGIYQAINKTDIKSTANIMKYAELQELIAKVIYEKKRFNSYSKLPKSLKNFLQNDFVKSLPKIKNINENIPMDDIAYAIIKNIEKILGTKYNLKPENREKYIKYFLYHVEKIFQYLSYSKNGIESAQYFIPNISVSASMSVMSVLYSIESNIKKRLIYIQNNKKDIFASNIWINPTYVDSTNNKSEYSYFKSKANGFCMGIEDSWYKQSNIVLGFCYSYAKSDIHGNQYCMTSLSAENNAFSSYGSFIFNNFIYDIQITYISSNIKKNREELSGFKYNSSYKNHTTSIEITTGKKFQLKNKFIFHPRVGCKYLRQTTESYKEIAGALYFNIKPHTYHNINLCIDATLYNQIYLYGIYINPELFIGINMKLINPNNKFTITLYDYRDEISANIFGRLQFKTGFGVLTNISGVNIRLEYYFKKDSKTLSNIINANISYYF